MLFGNGRTLGFASFELVLESGNARLTAPIDPRQGPPIGDLEQPAVDPHIELRRSNDNGKTWWSAGFREAGQYGDVALRPSWNRLGGTDQFAGFEVVVSAPINWRIVDALIDIMPGARV
jgi:hypothetical protein